MGVPMKTIKHIAISGLVLALVLGTLPACKRKLTEQPDPLGPSSLGIVLNLTSSVNAIFAGDQRQSTTISGVLKKFDGTPINGKTVHFQIGDAAGNKLLTPPGFFDGNQTVSSRVTDSAGNVSVNYHGPLSYEIANNVDIYIWATVAWEGAQSIIASTPVQIISDPLTLRVNAIAIPNVLFAGKSRDISTINVRVLTSSSVPLGGISVFFEIMDKDGEQRLPFGFFENNNAVAEKVTDGNGSVSVVYYGPLAKELQAFNQEIQIRATASISGSYDQPSQSDGAHLLLIADATLLNFKAEAYPSTLYAGTPRPESQIKTLATYEGAPISNRKVFFTIVQGPGFFSGNRTMAVVITDAEGVATITYFGPTLNEVAYTQYVRILAQLETSTTDHKSPPDPDYQDSSASYRYIDLRIVR
jgi:hypothetical protein